MSSFRRSVYFALQGIVYALRQERNFRLQLIALLLVLLMAWFLHLSFVSLAVILVMSAVVLMAELFNTALEALADAAHPATHPKIRLAKDMAAGAVLLASFFALLVGGLIFVVHWLVWHE